MFRYDLVLLAVALIPLGVAALYRLAIIPRRRRNIGDTLQLALDQSIPNRKTEQHAYLQKGTTRVRDDFESQYTARLLLPAALLSCLYMVAIPLSFSRVLQCHDCVDWLLILPRCFPAIPQFDFFLFAVLGAYTFNLGVTHTQNLPGRRHRTCLLGGDQSPAFHMRSRAGISRSC